MKNITLCATRIGQKKLGVEKTPNIIKNKLLLQNKKNINFYNIQDNIKYMQKFIHYKNFEIIQNINNNINPNLYNIIYEDIKDEDIVELNKHVNMINFKNGFEYNKKVHYSNLSNLNDKLNINIGGDHSIAIGSVSASLEKYKEDLIVIWIDAHPDINSYESSLSKNLHGMPLYYLTNSDSYLNESWLHENQLKYENLFYIGIRDIDAYESHLINQHNIQNINMAKYNTIISNDKKYKEHFEELLEKFKYKKIHLSIDVDSLDPSIIPCTGTSVPDGINLDYILKLIKTLKNNIINVDITELNLDINQEEKKISLENTLKIINELLK